MYVWNISQRMSHRRKRSHSHFGSIVLRAFLIVLVPVLLSISVGEVYLGELVGQGVLPAVGFLVGLLSATVYLSSLVRPGVRLLVFLPFAVSLPIGLHAAFEGPHIRLGVDTPLQAAVVVSVLVLGGLCCIYAARALPLIRKELREQSARRRTYILRIVYAGLAYVTALSFSADRFRQVGYSIQEFLGQGRELMQMYAALQGIGIYLFMPAMCCNLITSEKERDTLTLLFLTRMTPGQLLAGKFLSRLLPMLCFILLSLPLFGYAYSMGGFEVEAVVSMSWLLIVSALYVGSISLMFSCWFRTTVGAFIASYITILVLTFGPLLLYGETMLVEELFEWLQEVLETQEVFGLEDWELVGAVVPFYNIDNQQTFMWRVLHTTPILFFTGCLLAMARLFVVRRAAVKPKNRLLAVFRGFDRLFRFLNEKLCGDIMVLAGEGQLARDRPIAWRETTHRTMGTARYLIRLFMLIEYPVLFLCSISVGSETGLAILNFVLPLVWIVVVLLLCGASASVISAERGGQTLDVLLSTPMTGRNILSQKLTGLRRLTCVLSIPLLTIYIFQAMLRFDVPDLAPERSALPGMDPTTLTWCFLWSGIACVCLLLPVISWMSFWIGLRVRSQGRAIIVSVSVLVGWCLLPIIGGVVYQSFAVPDHTALMSLWDWLSQVSPMLLVHISQYTEFQDPVESLWWTVAIYLPLFALSRYWCLWRAPRVLGRADTPRKVRRSSLVHKSGTPAENSV